MFIDVINEVAALTAAGTNDLRAINDVCAKAPEGVAPYVNDVLGWVKYGVIALIFAAGFISTGALVAGKMGGAARASSFGAAGLMWTIAGAICYVVMYGILNGIVGNGC